MSIRRPQKPSTPSTPSPAEEAWKKLLEHPSSAPLTHVDRPTPGGGGGAVATGCGACGTCQATLQPIDAGIKRGREEASKEEFSPSSILVNALDAVGKRGANGFLIDELVYRIPVQQRPLMDAMAICRAYFACCLYGSGFDFAINELKPGDRKHSEWMEASASEDVQRELLEIHEVSLNALYVAALLVDSRAATASGQAIAKLREAQQVLTADEELALSLPPVPLSRVVELAQFAHGELTAAFDLFGTTLETPLVLFTGEDRDDDDMEDDEELTFEWPVSSYLSTSTDLNIAKRFSQSQMGFATGGVVWQLQALAGSRVLALTAGLTQRDGQQVQPLLRRGWVTPATILDESEVLLSKPRTVLASEPAVIVQ